MDPMRVVLADDSVLLREGLARLLAEAGFEVVGQAADAEGLLEQVAAHQPDVAIADIRMPPTPTAARAPPARSAPAIQASPSWCSPSTRGRATPSSC
jgi:DNA-binding NarL/FixJ family response regulator